MQYSLYTFIFSWLADSFENAYQEILPAGNWEINVSLPVREMPADHWEKFLRHTDKCYQVIQAWNIYFLAAGKNWMLVSQWAILAKVLPVGSWTEKSSCLVKHIHLAGGRSKICILSIHKPAVRYIVPDCLIHVQNVVRWIQAILKKLVVGCSCTGNNLYSHQLAGKSVGNQNKWSLSRWSDFHSSEVSRNAVNSLGKC